MDNKQKKKSLVQNCFPKNCPRVAFYVTECTRLQTIWLINAFQDFSKGGLVSDLFNLARLLDYKTLVKGINKDPTVLIPLADVVVVVPNNPVDVFVVAVPNGLVAAVLPKLNAILMHRLH